jgi:hypothetical protein
MASRVPGVAAHKSLQKRRNRRCGAAVRMQLLQRAACSA